MSTILITGGSGLIGTALTNALLDQGHLVRHLSRRAGDRNGIRTFVWDPSHGTIDADALDGAEIIVHLSGAPIADRRWTRARLKELDDSRAGAARLLRKAVHDHRVPLKSFISASGINYYGAVTSDHIFQEEDPPGMDTIGRLTLRWEEAADSFKDVCRVVKLRMPLVLARDGGALPRMAAPMRWTFAVPLGDGRQWWPWVYSDDVVRIYEQAISDERMNGSYNATAPGHATNRVFTQALARALKRPTLPVGIPALALRAVLGEAAVLLLRGSRASGEKLLRSGFRFQHAQLEPALRSLLQ